MFYENNDNYIEREDDFENVDSNRYTACVYTQLSMGNTVHETVVIEPEEDR